MKLAQAIKLACKAIDKEIKWLAIDANLYEMYGAPSYGKGYSERRKKLREAKKILMELDSAVDGTKNR